jgi:hypothetical protein
MMVTNLRVEEWHSLHQRLCGIAKRRAVLDAEEARCLRDAERVQLWRRLGYVHMGEYLERELGYGPHAGAERLRVARELGELPQIEAALAGGELPYSGVRELSRIATEATEGEWLEAARGKSLRQIEVLVSGRKRGDRPGDPAAPELVNRVVRLELSPEVFALFRQVQGVLADEHGGRLDDNAFIEALCRRAVEGDGSPENARPAHQIAITVCESCKRGWQNGAGREIEVSPEVVERARCDAELIGSVDADQPARVTATVTPRIRRQVLARDHHCCTVPGCRSARNLDLHHIEYQCDGGSHEMTNMTVLCSGHHNQLHDGALTIRGSAPDALEFTWRERVASAVDVDSVAQEARVALTTAGYKAHEARVAVEQARSHVGREGTLEQLLREALRCCAIRGSS